jgi:hypothetical protein
MRIGALLAVGAAGLLGAGAAEAATFSLSATCISACSEAGLAAGGMLSGRLTLDTSGFTANGDFSDASLRRFSVTFGSTTITSENAVAAHIDGQWGASVRDIVQFDMIGGTTVFPAVGGTFLLSNLNGIASTNGWCDEADCTAIGGTNASLGPVAIAAIPLPGAGLLLAGALAAFAAIGRSPRESRPPLPRRK